MHKFFLILTFVLHLSFTFASVLMEGASPRASFSLDNKDFFQLSGSFHSGDMVFNEVVLEDGNFTVISSEGYHSSMLIGFPELPEIHRLIELPQGAIPRVEILEEDFELHILSDYGISSPLIPHQPSLSKSQQPGDIPFEINDMAYGQDSFLVKDLVSIEDKGMLRAMRFANLIINTRRK